MKSVLIGTDFIYNSDGNLMPTEINTAIRHEIQIKSDLSGSAFLDDLDDYFYHRDFDSFLKEKNISKIILIDRPGGFHKIFEAFSAYYGYQYDDILLSQNQIAVPDVEDSEDTLIIRVAYDSYSLIDDLYCRDMYEFHNLIKDEDFAIPVKFTDTINLDTINIRKEYEDDDIPNYVIKSRVPGYHPTKYPKLYRLNTNSELDLLKSSIQENEFLQEYQWNSESLIDGRTSFIRSVDLVLDSLETVPLFSYKSINSVSTENELLQFDIKIDSDNKLDDLFASKFYPSWFSKTGLTYHYDETDSILMGDGTIKNAKLINSDTDLVLGIKFSNELSHFDEADIADLQNFTTLPTEIGGISTNFNSGIFSNITAYNSKYGVFNWYDGTGTPYLISKKDSPTSIIYQPAGELEVGDSVFIYDYEQQEIIPFEIRSIYYDIKKLETYLVSLRGKSDDNKLFSEFLVRITNNTYKDSKLFLIQHNACFSTCFEGSCATRDCNDCGKNSPNCIDCGGTATTFCNT